MSQDKQEIAPGIVLMRRKLFEAPVNHDGAFRDMRHAIKTAKVLGIRHFEIDITDGSEEEEGQRSFSFTSIFFGAPSPIEGDEWKAGKPEPKDAKNPVARVIVWAIAAVDKRMMDAENANRSGT